MIAAISYRNIWRNKQRSLVVMFAIAIGIWGALLVIGLAKGLTGMRHENAVSTYVSHIQIHDPDYLRFGLIEDHIEDTDQLEQYLSKDPQVESYSPRLKVEAFLQSTQGNSAVILNGIKPELEKSLTQVSEMLEEGNYFTSYKKQSPIIISKRLAERLNLEIGAKLRMSFANAAGQTVSTVYKVIDVFQTGNSIYDEVNAFVPYTVLAESAGLASPHEIALRLKDEDEVESYSASLQKEFPQTKVQTWRSLAPELGYADKMMDLVMTLFLSIIMAALAFGIVNTMLMAVLERKKELGMLMAVGMHKRQIFKMIMFETCMLSFIGAPIGMLMAIITQLILGKTGIDLSFVAKGLESVGLESTIYPSLDVKTLLILSVLVVITGILSAIYPAKKALGLNPSETLRTAI